LPAFAAAGPTAAQVDEVLREAGKQIASSAEVGDKSAVLVGGDAECRRVIDELKKAAKK
jgi:hypothetical protein